MATDKEFVLRLRVNADGTLEPVQKLGDELDNAEEKTKNLGETAKKSEGGFKKLADGIKNIGKATGVIALVAAAFNTIKSVDVDVRETSPYRCNSYPQFRKPGRWASRNEDQLR